MANKNREGAQMILRNCAFFNIYVLNSLWRVLFFKNVFFRIAKLATEEAQEASAAMTCSAAQFLPNHHFFSYVKNVCCSSKCQRI
jgi:hypothetical protein